MAKAATKPSVTITNGKAKKVGVRNPNPREATQADEQMGQRIRLRRVELKLSQDELGRAIGVSFQQIQKYEKGVNRIGAARLEQIATVLKVDIPFFFGGTTKAREVESLLFTDSNFALKLLKAYKRIDDPTVQRQFVALMETMADALVGANK